MTAPEQQKSILAQLESIHSLTKELHAVHDQVDEDGVPVWYVRTDHQQVIEDVADRTAEVAEAVGELVVPVKQVLRTTRSVMNLTRLVLACMLALNLGLAFGLWRQQPVDESRKASADLQRAVDNAIRKLAAVKEDVDEIPKILVRPASTADPTGKPVAVIKPGRPRSTSAASHKGAPAPKPPPQIEIPLDLTPKK